MIKKLIRKKLEEFIGDLTKFKHINEISEQLAEEIGEQEVAIAGEWIKLKELY